MCFTRKLPENGKKERLGLTRAGSGNDQEILAINKAVANHCCPKQDRVMMSAVESEGFGN